jgi:hypothetical protein
LYQVVGDVVEACLSQIQQMRYSRHPEQSAALQILPHFHSDSVETVLLEHCSACMESSMGTVVGREDVFLLGWVELERLAAATVRDW